VDGLAAGWPINPSFISLDQALCEYRKSIIPLQPSQRPEHPLHAWHLGCHDAGWFSIVNRLHLAD
jgi:hypothetical protein